MRHITITTFLVLTNASIDPFNTSIVVAAINSANAALSRLSPYYTPHRAGAFGSCMHWSTLINCLPVAFAIWMNCFR